MFRPFTRISRGAGPASYTLQLPFFLVAVGEFPEAEALEVRQSLAVTLGDRPASIIRMEHYYIIRVEDFASEGEAKDFIEKIGASLFHLSLKQRMGIHFRHEPVPVEREHNLVFRNAFPPEYYDGWELRADETFTDGGVWPNTTVIIPEHERIVEYSMFFAHRVANITSKDIAESFAYTEENIVAGELFKNPKLPVAFDVYSSAYSQHNRLVTFLHLVTVLEILSKRRRYMPATRKAVDYLVKIMQGMRDDLADSGMESKAQDAELTAIISRMSDLKCQSISGSIRQMVYECVHSAESISREESERIVTEIYKVRSELVHGGRIKVPKSQQWHERFGVISDLERIVRALLAREYNKALKEHGIPVNFP